MHFCVTCGTRRTSHASLMKRWEGKQRRIHCCSILQQQLHTFQATGCTGITQWSAAIDVTSIHLEGTEPWLSHKHTSQSGTDKESYQLGFSRCALLTPSHLCTSVQQQSDALGLSLYTGLMQRGDGVNCHDVNCCTSLDQLLQLEGSALCGSLMHRWPIRPESKAMSCKYVKPNQTRPLMVYGCLSVDLWLTALSLHGV